MTATSGSHQFTVRTAPDRTVHALTAGPEDGLPLVFHYGTPGGLVPYEPMTRAAADRGVRIVLYARPGYGDSTPLPGRRVADAAADVAAILDHLGVTTFITAGWSGGGPHALATGALLADRCQAVASIAGVAPRHAEGLDWLAGMAPENIDEYAAADAGEAQLTVALNAMAAMLAQVTGEQVGESLGELASPADLAALTGGFAGFMAASFRAAMRTGIAGWRDDDLAFTAPWGFDLSPLGSRVPVSVWQGDQDTMVPFAHGQWLASHLTGAGAHLLPGDGHLTLVASRFGEILDDLLAIAGR